MAERPAYWAVIPASVRYDQDLPPNAKLLYGEVTALSDKRGYCYAQNGYFSELFSLSERSITRLFALPTFLSGPLLTLRRRTWMETTPLPTILSGPLMTILTGPLPTKMSGRTVQVMIIIYPL